jgi:hypothetical protein
MAFCTGRKGDCYFLGVGIGTSTEVPPLLSPFIFSHDKCVLQTTILAPQSAWAWIARVFQPASGMKTLLPAPVNVDVTTGWSLDVLSVVER